MEGLLSLLVWAAIFYLLMRFCFGAHMIHGGHGKHGNHGGGDVKHQDPVCGMQVEPDKGYGKMHDGELYRFCSRRCLDKFEADPDAYLTQKEG